MNKRKILYFDTALKFWGGQRSLYELISKLDRNYYRPFVAVPNDSLGIEKFGALTDVYTFPAHSTAAGALLRPFPALRSISAFSNIINAVKPDIIHANTFLSGFILSLIPSLKTPWILHQRDTTYHRIATRWVTARAVKIIAVSKTVSNLFETIRLKRPLSVITDGVDVTFTTRIAEKGFVPPLRKKLGLKQNETLVGTVGTISAQKSQHDVLEAAAALRDISGLYFVCVGEPYRAEDSEYFNKLARRRTELGLENSFFFADFTEDLADVYGSIDILAHAAKNEGLGRVILEAMAAGVPALARNESGPSEIVESGVDGLLFEPDNINDFVGKLKLIVTNRELRRNLSLEGKKKVSEKYTIEKSVSQIQNIYREISGN